MSVLKIPTKELTYEKKVALKQLLERFGYPKKSKWKLFCELLSVPENEVRAYLNSEEGKVAMKRGRYKPVRHDINDLLDLEEKHDLNPCYTRLESDMGEFLEDADLTIGQLTTGKHDLEFGGRIKNLRSKLNNPEDQEDDK